MTSWKPAGETQKQMILTKKDEFSDALKKVIHLYNDFDFTADWHITRFIC